MDPCTLCHRPATGPRLTDPRSGTSAHTACVAERLPHDVTVAAVGAAALFFVPFLRVWAA